MDPNSITMCRQVAAKNNEKGVVRRWRASNSTRGQHRSLPISNSYAGTYTHKDVGLWGWGLKTGQLPFNVAYCFSTMIYITCWLVLGPINEGPREPIVKKWASSRLDMVAAVQRNGRLFPEVSYSHIVLEFIVFIFFLYHISPRLASMLFLACDLLFFIAAKEVFANW